MLIIYIVFFGILNLLIFSHLTRKIELSSGLKIALACILLVIGIIHFVNPFETSRTNELFLILFCFSLSLFVFHYGSRIAIWFTIQINKQERDHILFKGYDILIFYVVYAMIFIFQIVTLIKN